jgi:hypothetical protein
VAIFVFSGSIGLLADLIHNFGDFDAVAGQSPSGPGSPWGDGSPTQQK